MAVSILVQIALCLLLTSLAASEVTHSKQPKKPGIVGTTRSTTCRLQRTLDWGTLLPINTVPCSWVGIHSLLTRTIV